MLRAIIIDDEEAGVESLKTMASRNSASVRIVASTLEAEEGITLIEDYKPDLVFLDISMPSMSGFELLARVSFRDFKLVFTTAHREYAIEAIKNRAFDYLLKPISEADFRLCIEKIQQEGQRSYMPLKHESNLLLEVQAKDGIIYLKQKELIRLEASRSYTELYMDNGSMHIASKNLKDFESRLDSHIFFRCHKSHIINLQKVQKFINHEGLYVLMSNGSMPDVSRNLKDVLLERLKMI